MTSTLAVQNALRQQLELDRDAAVHRQQLEIDRHAHALQLVQEAHTAAQTDSDRLRNKHAQELQLCEVTHYDVATVLSLTVLIRPSDIAATPVRQRKSSCGDCIACSSPHALSLDALARQDCRRSL